ARRRAFSCFDCSSAARPAGIGVPPGVGDVEVESDAGVPKEAPARGAASGTGIEAGRSSAATAGADIAREVSRPSRDSLLFGSGSGRLAGGSGTLGAGGALSVNEGGEPKRGGAPPRSKPGSAGGRF